MFKVRRTGPRLPRAAWWVLSASVICTVGCGAALPYLFVYLHLGHHLTAGTVGELLTVRAAAAVAGAPLGGAAADRFGARRASLLMLAVLAVSVLALLDIPGTAIGILVLAAFGVAGSACGVAMNSLLAQATPSPQRTRVFAVLTVAEGIAASGGAAVAALMLTLAPGAGYTLVYSGSAAAVAASTLVVWRCKFDAPTTPPGPPGSRDGGYLTVLADPAMRWICLIVAVVVGAGYCQLEVGLPAYALASSVPGAEVGWVYAINSAALVTLQLPVQQLTSPWRRTSSLRIAIMIMTSGWVIAVATPVWGLPALLAAGVLLGTGQVFLAPVVLALVNDLAPPRLLGRYNGVFGLAWTSGWLAGTALTTAVLAAGHTAVLFPVLAVLLLSGMAAVKPLRRRLPAGRDHPSTAQQPDGHSPTQEAPIT